MKRIFILLVAVTILPAFFLFGQHSSQDIGKLTPGPSKIVPATQNSLGISIGKKAPDTIQQILDHSYSVQSSSENPKLIIHRAGPDKEFFPLSGSSRDIGENVPVILGKGFSNKSTALTDLEYSCLFVNHSYSYYWAYNYEWSGFQPVLDTQGATSGRRIEDLDTYGSSTFQYGGIWIDDSKDWAWALNYDSDGFVDQLNNYAQDYRITDIEVHEFNSQLYYGGVWKDDSYGWAWALNYTWTDFQAWLNTWTDAGYRPIDIEVYPGSQGLLYAGVMQENSDGYGWAWAINYNWNDFKNNYFDPHNTAGKRLIDYEVYSNDGTILYAGAWVDDNKSHGWALNYNITSSEFATKINEYRDNHQLYPFMFNMWDADEMTDVQPSFTNIPREIDLAQNYPNPFNPSTTIIYSVPRSGFVHLAIYDELGKTVRTMVNENQSASSYSITWDGRNTNGQRVASGIYYYTLKFEEETIISKRMIMVK